MKANYKRNMGKIQPRARVFTESELMDFVNTEWDKHKDEVYQIAVRDVSAQILAVMFSTLYKPPYNWREKRLKDLKSRFEFTFENMAHTVLGKDFSTIDCMEFLKSEFGIDFDKNNIYDKRSNVEVRR